MVPVQSRMARAALNWTRQRLADKANIPARIVSRFERGLAVGAADVARLHDAFERAGLAFVGSAGNGPGVVVLHQTALDTGIRPENLTAANDD